MNIVTLSTPNCVRICVRSTAQLYLHVCAFAYDGYIVFLTNAAVGIYQYSWMDVRSYWTFFFFLSLSLCLPDVSPLDACVCVRASRA